MTRADKEGAPAITVHKLDPAGHHVTSYPGKLIEHVAGGIKLEAYWTRPALPLGYTTFETGDRFIEWFYSDRWYNIFAIFTAGGALKGWYCNIAEPARITASEITCRDLLLDLWVNPDGACRVLDEDEFASDINLTDAERAHALRGLDQLRDMVNGRLPPFDEVKVG
ncbi:MAG TPA: DUF402 domain-containing protein [Ktedonobacterales bacterium]|nr:DUF402 domain-containing protein [Ktedonobacterales bacterium]